jgi:hypothetical protein
MSPQALISSVNAILWLLVLAGGAAIGVAFSRRTGIELVLVGIAVPLAIIGISLLLHVLSEALRSNFAFAFRIYGRREMMTVIAIAGLLLAIGMPLYQDYRVQSLIEQSLEGLGPAKRSIENYFAGNRGLPASIERTLLSPGKTLSAIRYERESGALIVVFSVEPIEGRSVRVKPVPGGYGGIVWECKTVDVPARYLPDFCH